MEKALYNSCFKNLYYHEKDDEKIFCFRTGLTVYEEIYSCGRYVNAGFNCTGYPSDLLPAIPSTLDYKKFREPQAFDIEADGTSLSWDWKFEGFEENEEQIENRNSTALHIKVTLKSLIKPVKVIVHTVLDGTPIMTRWLEVENTSASPVSISAVSPYSGSIELIYDWRRYERGIADNSRIYSLGYFDKTRWGHEGSFSWHSIHNDELSFCGKYLKERFRQPFFFLRNNLTGSMTICQMGWSGGYKFSFDLDAEEDDSLLSVKLAMDSQKPLIILDGKEMFETPKVHIGTIQGDMDDAVNLMNKHLRLSVFTSPDVEGKKGWFVGGIGPERYMDIEAIKHMAEQTSEVGAEALIIDAGWFCPPGKECTHWAKLNGDWYADKERFPNGISEVRDYIHSKGMKFGLWLDLEDIGCDSQAFKEHPDWLSKSFIHGYVTHQLDMTRPEVVAWTEGELTRVIEDYGVELFRLDYNVSTSDLLNKTDKGHGQENAYIRYYKNTNEMYKRLRKRFPNVIFENCAGGGGRTDVGFLSNFHHTWVSDWNEAPRSFAITNEMTMCLPPEIVNRVVSGMNCHRRASLGFQIRNALFGSPTVNDFSSVRAQENSDQLSFAKHEFDIYINFVRRYAGRDMIFHHTPEVYENSASEFPTGTGVIERAADDGNQGIVGIFRLADAGNEENTRVFPRGVNPADEYVLTFDNSGYSITVTGYDMMNNGVNIRLSGSMTSELLIYEKR